MVNDPQAESISSRENMMQERSEAWHYETVLRTLKRSIVAKEQNNE